MDDHQMAQLRQEAILGERMFALLNDDEVNSCLKKTREEIRSQWENETDTAEREQLWLKISGLRTFLLSLQTVIDAGKMASAALTQEANHGKR